jgi:hypothetical protein
VPAPGVHATRHKAWLWPKAMSVLLLQGEQARAARSAIEGEQLHPRGDRRGAVGTVTEAKDIGGRGLSHAQSKTPTVLLLTRTRGPGRAPGRAGP